MLTAATVLAIPGPADGASLIAATPLILIAALMMLPSAAVRLLVWIDEGLPGVPGRLAADRRRDRSTACPTSPDSTHGVAR